MQVLPEANKPESAGSASWSWNVFRSAAMANGRCGLQEYLPARYTSGKVPCVRVCFVWG